MTGHGKFRVVLAVAVIGLVLTGCGRFGGAARVDAHEASDLPVTRWDFRPESDVWTGATLDALRSYGAVLAQTVPSDIARFCPAYPKASTADRNAFWAGMISALAKYESTWNPKASGGGGLWLGLMQIDPRTAKGHGCAAQSKADLLKGAGNLRCAVRIAAKQVGRDAEIVGGPGRWRGLGRDWAPMRNKKMVDEMAAWTRKQAYCKG